MLVRCNFSWLISSAKQAYEKHTHICLFIITISDQLDFSDRERKDGPRGTVTSLVVIAAKSINAGQAHSDNRGHAS
jgi:hypothetical protein